MKLEAKLDNSGIDRMAQNLDGADALIAEASGRIAKAAKLLIQHGQKTGHEYKRGKKVHIASAPGEAPANDFGTLATSIAIRKIRPLLRIVFVGADYGAILELWRNRPFLAPAVEKVRPWFEGRLKKMFGGS